MIEGLAEIDARETRAEDLAAGFADQVARDAFGADLFAFVFQLELSGDRGDRGVNIADPGSDYGLVVMQCAPLGVRQDALHLCDRQALADAGSFINAFIVTRDERDLFDDFADGLRDQKSQLIMIGIIAVIAVAIGPGLLLRDLDAFFYRSRVMSLNLRADPVLERRDNFAARRVIFGVGREDQQHVKWQPDRITLNLHVSFLHDVEQSDLNLSGQVRQFVDGDNAAVGAGQQAVMDRQLVREQVSSARRLDRVNVADDVRDGHVGRRQLFNISRVTVNPVNRRIVALFGDYLFAVSADRMERIIVDLRPGDDRYEIVEQTGQFAQDAALGLPSEVEHDNVVLRQQLIDYPLDNGVFLTDDAVGNLSFVIFVREQVIAVTKSFDQVVAYFVFNRTSAVPHCFQLAKGLRYRHIVKVLGEVRSSE